MPAKSKTRKLKRPPKATSTRRSTRKRVTKPKTKKIAAEQSEKVTLSQIFPNYTKEKFAQKVSHEDAKILSELSQAYMRHGLVLYVGAGVSMSFGLPSWVQLIRSLTVNMMSGKFASAVSTLDEQTQERSWSMIWELQSDLSRKADYQKPILMMARAIKDAMGEKLPDHVGRHLYFGNLTFRDYFLRLRRRYGYRDRDRQFTEQLPSSSLLDSIVALARAERDVVGVRAIVNYNYDDLLEEKLREQKVRCMTVRSGSDDLPSGTLASYHVHGVLPFKTFESRYLRGAALPAVMTLDQTNIIGNFVFSEDEYHTEYADPYRWSNMTQMRLLGQYTGLFVGSSLEDPNIRRLIDVTHKQYPGHKNYAILPRKETLQKKGETKRVILRNLFEEVETTSFEKIGVKVVWVDKFDEIPELLNKIAFVN